MKKILFIIVFLVIGGVLKYYYEMYLQAIYIKNEILLFDRIHGCYPSNPNDFIKSSYLVSGEMYKYDGMKFKFYYEYSDYLNDYIIVINSYYPPNLIYFFKTDKFDFNSTLYSDLGL